MKKRRIAACSSGSSCGAGRAARTRSQQRLVLQLIEGDARERGTHLVLSVARAGDVVHRERGQLFPAEQDWQQLRERIGVRGPQSEPQATPVVAGETLPPTEAYGLGERRARRRPNGLARERDRLDSRDGCRVVHCHCPVRSYGDGVTDGDSPSQVTQLACVTEGASDRIPPGWKETL